MLRSAAGLVAALLVALGVCVGIAEGAACDSKQLYRYITLHKYGPNVKVADALDAEAKMLKACAASFVRGAIGLDMGLGPTLYNSSGNAALAKVLDFEALDGYKAYKACQAKQAKQPPSPSLKAKGVLMISSCPGWAPGATANLTHYTIFNMTTKDTSAATLAQLKVHVDASRAGVSCVTYNDYYGPTADWGTQLQDPDFYPFAGQFETKVINGMRAAWGWIFGPPPNPDLLRALPYYDNPVRIQITYTKVK